MIRFKSILPDLDISYTKSKFQLTVSRHTTKSKMNQLMIKHLKRKRPAKLEDYYNFMHDKRGIAIIFNHETFIDPVHTERKGTRKDGQDLKDVLKKLNFDVRDYMNLKLQEIKDILYEVSREDHSKNDCLWVTVMSHGGKDGKIYSSDEHYQVEELWENFLGEKCESLIGKPKMFFIQACRGDKIDPGAVESDGEHPVSKKITIPQFADLLVMYSTFALHLSFRNTFEGSWFIQALCEELNAESDSHDGLYDDLMHILARVNRKVASRVTLMETPELKEAKQTTYIESTLRKSIIFFNKSSMIDKACENLCYDMSNVNRGVALIFNQEFDTINTGRRNYDTDDLKAVLEILQFDVRIYKNLKVDEIRKILYEVSIEDHSNNDSLLVIVMTNGKEDGQIGAAEDKYYSVQELWDNFVGDNCKSLIGKPKLFFIGARRGDFIDSSVSMKHKPNQSIGKNNENLIDSIPHSADYLVMYSTTEDYSSFHSETDGSKFIQAICEEFKTNLEDDLITILTSVNKNVAFAAQSNTTDKLIVGTQMANIESTLTKTLYLTSSETKSDLHYDFSNVNRGIALIFNHEYFNDKPRRAGAKKDGEDLKAVLQELQFVVRNYMDLELDEIKKVLNDVSKKDHSNNDCLWVTVMSHGGKDGTILAKDKEYNVRELREIFLGNNCESLIGKPKLFFIDACRGDKTDPGVPLKLNKESDEMGIYLSEKVYTIPKLADLMVMYATIENHMTFTNSPYKYSWFIEALLAELKTYLQDDFLSMLTRVNKRVANYYITNGDLACAKQMPIIVSMLTKTLCFTPKNEE